MGLLFRQLFESESSTYTYLIADDSSREAIIIDPVKETLERDIKLIKELGLTLKYILETHVHADHITSSGPMRDLIGGEIALGEANHLKTVDHLLKDNQELQFGAYKVKAIATPGHTAGCVSYLVERFVFTGDTLLIRGCGRTDFQEGDSQQLFHSVREKLFVLSDDVLVYPGHDYQGRTCSSIGEEKKWNPRLDLNKSEKEFIQIMKNLNLQDPKKIAVAVPANLNSGL